MILFLLRLLIIVVVAATFLVLLSKKLSGALPSSRQPPVELPLLSRLYNYYSAKKWKDCPLSSGKWSAGLGTARHRACLKVSGYKVIGRARGGLGANFSSADQRKPIQGYGPRS